MTTPNISNIALYSASRVFSNMSLVCILVFVTAFTNGENLFFNFNHVIVTFIVTCILVLLNMDKLFFHKKILSSYFFLFIVLFVISFFASMYFGLDYTSNPNLNRYDITFDASLRSLLFKIPMHLTLIFFIYLGIDRLSEIKRILFAFILCALAVNIITLFLLSTGINTIEGRLASTFEDPNYLGRLEVISIAISICYLIFKESSFNLKMIIIANMVFSFLIQVFTYSRSSVLSLVAVIILIFYFSKSKFLKIIFTSGLILGMVLLIPIMSSVRYGAGSDADISFISTFLDPSNALRILLNLIALKMFVHSPFFGVGYNNFYNVMLNYSEFFPISLPLITNTVIVHSWLFTLLAEQGLLGFISFVSLLIISFRRLVISIKQRISSDNLFVGVSLLSLFFIVVFNGLFFPTIIMELLFSLICGLIGSYLKIMKINYSSTIEKLRVL